MPHRTTLTQFIIEEQRRTVGATGDFTGLLNDVALACKAIANTVNRGQLIGVLCEAVPADTREFAMLHQRVAVILGSQNEVQRIVDYHAEAARAAA